jgi:uncharacterized membrane protein YhaH (DUF805 family)
MNWYLAVLKNYTEFSRRERKKEYWMLLFNMISDNVPGITMGGGHRQ